LTFQLAKVRVLFTSGDFLQTVSLPNMCKWVHLTVQKETWCKEVRHRWGGQGEMKGVQHLQAWRAQKPTEGTQQGLWIWAHCSAVESSLTLSVHSFARNKFKLLSISETHWCLVEWTYGAKDLIYSVLYCPSYCSYHHSPRHSAQGYRSVQYNCTELRILHLASPASCHSSSSVYFRILGCTHLYLAFIAEPNLALGLKPALLTDFSKCSTLWLIPHTTSDFWLFCFTFFFLFTSEPLYFRVRAF